MAADEYWLSAFYSHQGQEKPDQPDNSWNPPAMGDFGFWGDEWNGGYWAFPGGSWGDLISEPTPVVRYNRDEYISFPLGAINWQYSHSEGPYEFMVSHPDRVMSDPDFWTHGESMNQVSVAGGYSTKNVSFLPGPLPSYYFSASSIYPVNTRLRLYAPPVSWSYTWATTLLVSAFWQAFATPSFPFDTPVATFPAGYKYRVTSASDNPNYVSASASVKNPDGSGATGTFVGNGQSLGVSVTLGYANIDRRTGEVTYTEGSMSGHCALIIRRTPL